jgi:hypothetical protein
MPSSWSLISSDKTFQFTLYQMVWQWHVSFPRWSPIQSLTKAIILAKRFTSIYNFNRRFDRSQFAIVYYCFLSVKIPALWSVSFTLKKDVVNFSETTSFTNYTWCYVQKTLQWEVRSAYVDYTMNVTISRKTLEHATLWHVFIHNKYPWCAFHCYVNTLTHGRFDVLLHDLQADRSVGVDVRLI